jgi:hypothetical protein
MVQMTHLYHLNRFYFLSIIFLSFQCTNTRHEIKNNGENQSNSNIYHVNLGIVATIDNSNSEYSEFYNYEAKFHFHSDLLFDSICLTENGPINIGKYTMKFRNVNINDHWGQIRDKTIGNNILIGEIMTKDSLKYNTFISDIQSIMKTKKFQLKGCTLQVDSIYFPKAMDATHIHIQ